MAKKYASVEQVQLEGLRAKDITNHWVDHHVDVKKCIKTEERIFCFDLLDMSDMDGMSGHTLEEMLDSVKHRVTDLVTTSLQKRFDALNIRKEDILSSDYRLENDYSYSETKMKITLQIRYNHTETLQEASDRIVRELHHMIRSNEFYARKEKKAKKTEADRRALYEQLRKEFEV